MTELTMARDYLKQIRIAAPQMLGATAFPEITFQDATDQAVVAGAEVVAFSGSVESAFREAIADSALIAQLAANARFDAGRDPIAWFDHYFSIMGGLGWTTQARDTAYYNIAKTGMEVHEVVLDVVHAFLGPIPGAAALVELALKSLKNMNQDRPFITLFNKESERAEAGRFQFTLVEQKNETFLANAMSFGLQARRRITQVLFIKLDKTETNLRRSLGTVSIGRDALDGLRPLLKAKVIAQRSTFLAELPLA